MKQNKLQARRKAQMEILGIALVVVILIFALLFWVRIKLDTPRDSFETFSKKAVTPLVTILGDPEPGIYTDCNGETFLDLVKDCSYGDPMGNIECGEDAEGTIMHSCKYVKNMLEVILGDTLAKYEYKYEFWLYDGQTDALGTPTEGSVIADIHLIDGCVADSPRESLTQVLVGDVNLRLDVCG
jgi:hypothetical protein